MAGHLVLVRLLEAGGHGAEGMSPLEADSQPPPAPRALNRARSHPDGSRLGTGFAPSESRGVAVGRIADALDTGI